MIQRTDPHTGETFYATRSNQRFATRRNQVAYNNAKAKELRDQMNDIDNFIKKNLQILCIVVGDNNKAKCSKDFLLGKGFNFRFFNNQRVQDNNRYFGIYNYGIRPLENDKYEIIKFNDNE
jgi:7-keto-8-aminopelargonate synthetase-like enzyme